MRITNKIIQNNSITNINNNKVMEDKLNTQLATGKKVNRPSDDPVVAIRALRLRTSLSEVEQYYTKNVPDAKSWLSITENAVKSVTDVITSMYEDFTSGAAGFKTPEDREAILENLKGLRDEYYSIGNADYAGRHVFTGYRTDTSFTFTEDTTADYRGINDSFNASDVGRVTYVEGTLNAEDVNGLITTGNDETAVKEDRVNRIRLSYDNINGSVLSGLIEGWSGDELGAISGWELGAEYGKYFNEDGTLNNDGQSFSGQLTIDGAVFIVKFNEPYDQTFSFSPEYGENPISDSSVSGTSDEIKVKLGDIYYTVTRDATSGTYSVDGGATVNDDGSGNLTLTIPGPNGTNDIYSEVKIDASGATPSLTSANKYTRISDVNYWISNFKYDRENMTPAPDVSGTPDEIKVKVGDTTYTVTKQTWGYHAEDLGTDAEVDDSGNLVFTIGGVDSKKEIVIDPSGPSLISADDCTRITDSTDYAGGTNNGGKNLSGKVFGSRASDTTTLIYRTELAGQASISPNSVNVDPVDGIQSFEIKHGSTKYKIQNFPNEGRWFAVDDSGQAIKNIKVEQNTDGSFTVYAATDGSVTCHQEEKDGDVFNVSADGNSIISCYRQNAVDVKITDSTSAVASDVNGNNLTAYQYLALDDDNKNEGEAADAVYLLADTGELVFGSNIAKTLSNLKDIDGVDTISVLYDKSNYEKGDIRPEHYFDATLRDDKHTALNPIIYDEQDQEIDYTIGTNQSIRINTNASEVFDPQVARMLDDIIDNIEEVKAAEDKVNRLKSMQADTATYGEADQKKIDILLDTAQKALTFLTDKLQKQFEGGLTSSQGFLDKANTALTAIGNRSARVDLVENRLQSQSTNFKTLSSENEDADITEVAVQLSSAEMSYQGALMATGKIAQTTLLNYL